MTHNVIAVIKFINYSSLHARDEFLAFGFESFILFDPPLHVVGMRLGVMSPAFFLEEIFDLGDVVLDKDLTIVTGSASLQRRRFERGGEIEKILWNQRYLI